MADDSPNTTDRAGMLAEAYKRDILPPDVKAQYEEAMKRGLVKGADAKAEPSAYAKSQEAQRKDASDKIERVKASDLPQWSKDKLIGDLQKRTQPDAPKFDVVGDIGKAAQGAVATMGEAFNGPKELAAQDAANREKYGPVLGAAKGAFADPLMNSAKLPLGALSLIGSPLTGTAHALAGSALSYLPGMNKQLGDEAVDYGMAGMAPGRVSGPAAIAAAESKAATGNALARAANPTFAQARDAGYVVHPSDVNGGRPGMAADTMSAVGGKVKTQQQASVANQKVTNGIAAKELGLPPDTILDESTFASVRGKSAKAYKAIENSATKLPGGKIMSDVGYRQAITDLDDISGDLRKEFPELTRNEDIQNLQESLLKPEFSPKAGIDAIRVLRTDASSNLKAWDKPKQVALGRAQRAAANAMEELIDRQLTAAGDAQAVTDYRTARQMIAKSHDIEAVTDARGNVDARKLSTLGGKRPLSGGLKTIADTADAYPKSMQNPDKFGGLEKHSILDAVTSVISAVGGITTHNPAWMAGAALPLARPVARSLALSERVQNRLLGLKKPNYLGAVVGQGAPALGQQNGLQSVLARPEFQTQPNQGQ